MATILILAGGLGAALVVLGDEGDTTTASAPTSLEPGWNELPSPPLRPRASAAIAPTGDGVLVWGGLRPDPEPDEPWEATERRDGAHLDLSTGEWTPLPDAPFDGPAGAATGTDTPDGTVIITEAGPDGEMAAAVYDHESRAWSDLPDPPFQQTSNGTLPPARFVGDEGDDGYVVLVTPWGHDAPAADRGIPPSGSQLWVLDLGAREWQESAPAPRSVRRHHVIEATAAADQLVLTAYTDESSDQCATVIYTYTPSDDTWSDELVTTSPVQTLDAITWTGADLFVATGAACTVVGGADVGANTEPEAWALDLDSGQPESHAAPRLVDGAGWWTGTAVATTDRDGRPLFYDVASSEWHRAPEPPTEVEPADHRRYTYAAGAMVTLAFASGDDRVSTDELAETGYAYVPATDPSGD